MDKIQTTITLNDEDVDVEVTFKGGHYDPGVWGGPPDRWEPPSGEDPELTSVKTLVGGQELVPGLDPAIYDKLVAEVWEHLNDRDDPRNDEPDEPSDLD